MHHVAREFVHDTDAPNLEQIVLFSLGFLMRIVPSRDLTQVIRGASCACNVIAYRKKFHSNGYLLKNVKLWLWEAVKKEHSLRKAVKRAPRFQVEDKDLVLARTFLTFFLETEPYRETLKELTDKFKSHPLPFYEESLVNVWKECEEYASRFAFHRMRFLTWNNSHYDLEDIKYELLTSGMLGVQRQYPKIESFLHMVNILKRSIHNAGINLIKYHTTNSRATMPQNEDGSHTSLLISLESVSNENGYLRRKNQIVDLNGVDLNNDEGRVEPRVFSTECIARSGRREDKALGLLLGDTEDVEFSNFLGRNSIEERRRYIDTDQTDKFLGLVAEYMEVAPNQMPVFLNRVQTRLRRIV